MSDDAEAKPEPKMTELPKELRPRERLLRCGADKLTDEELLAIIFRTGVQGCNVQTLARRFIAHLGKRGLTELRTYDADHFRGFVAAHKDDLKGIGDDKIVTLLATIEFGIRVLMPNKRETLRKPLLLAGDMAKLFFSASTRHVREGFWALFLDKSRRPISYEPTLITQGLLDQTLIDAGTLFRHAIFRNADSVVVAHNHPTGDLTPSERDIHTTENLIRAGRILGIALRDHIILGSPALNPSYLSIRAAGLCSF